VDATRWIEAQVHAGEMAATIKTYSDAIQSMARVKPLTLTDGRLTDSKMDNALVTVLKDSDVVIPMAGMVDIEAEKKRKQKDIEETQAEVERLGRQLSNSEFLSKAPTAVVEKEKNKLETLKEKLERLKQQVA
jgi:valyl-tRNA synthetase